MKLILNDMKWSRYNLKIFFKRRKARRTRDAEIKKCLMEVEQILNDGSIGPSWKFMKLSMLQTRVRMIALSPLPSHLSEKQHGRFVLPDVKGVMIKANASGIRLDEKKIVNAIKELHVDRNKRPC